MKRLLIPFLLLFLSGCAWLKGGESNVTPPAPLTAFKPTITVHKLWSVSTGDGAGKQYLTLRPALAGDRLFVADHAGHVASFQARSGKRLWHVDLGVGLTGATGYGNGYVVLGGRTGQVIALNAETGARVWMAQASSEVLAPPLVTAGAVVVQTIDGKLTALGLADGSVMWTEDHTQPALSLYASSAPVAVGDLVVSGFADGRVSATNLLTGTTTWQATLGQPKGTDEIERLVDVDATPVVADGVIYAASYQGTAVALAADSGRVIWSTPASTYRNIGLGTARVYLSNADDAVQALDRATGAVAWTQAALKGRRISGPALIGNEVVVGDYAGYVHWLARASGAFVARSRVGESAIRAQPVVGVEDGKPVLFVLSQQGRLTALAPSS